VAALLVGLTAAIGLAIAGWNFWAGRAASELPEFVTTAAWKGPYELAIIEPGTIESASSVEIRSLVRVRGGTTTILDVVPEGSFVNEGDKLVELDASALQIEENAQKILVETRESLLAEAKNTLDAAKIARLEYLEGLYVTQEKTLASALFVAERTKNAAENALESAKTLHAEAIFTSLQVQSAYSYLEECTNNYEAARTALDTLRNLTKRKELTLLDANIASAEANVQAQLQSLRVEEERLQFVQEQIANCTIKAPAAGQVVYANESDYRGGSQFVVAPGSTVRERQTIIWLPNPKDMQVRATVNEARVTSIRAGLQVSIRVTALHDEVLEGEVVKVSQYAEPSMSSTGNIKKYATFIKIKNPPSELRVGMNAEVRIHVERADEALQIPVQALAESQGRYFSLVKDGDEYETREITIASTNDKFATIARGLAEGDEVILNPRSTGDLLELPEVQPASLVVSGANTADATGPTLAAQPGDPKPRATKTGPNAPENTGGG
jgi:HlyD family secretion protein